jgi:peptidoglycan hydrolase-like protein with peptidoglycan-binding domain
MVKIPGPIDGIMGPRTKAALKDFQRAQGLPETGRLDAETMTKLGAKGTPSERRMEKTPQEQTEKTPQEKKPY